MIKTLAQPGDSERDLALRFAAAAEFLMPLVGPTIVHALQANMLEQIRRDVIAAADLASGGLGGTANLTVCFADLVEFTRLGEEIPAEELGLVAGRLEEMATAVADPPVRLVKTIGDAVMFVSTEPEAMQVASLELIGAAEAEGDEFPLLRAGLACGPVLPQSGDYYGRPVNLASRITGVARPGSVVVDSAVKKAAGEAFKYTYIGERRLKGIDSKVKLVPRSVRAGLARTKYFGGGKGRERASTPPPPAFEVPELRRLASRDEQVVEELGRQVWLEHPRVHLLQGDVAAEGEVAPAQETESGSAVDSTVRSPQPQALESSSSPPTWRCSKPPSRSSLRRSAGAKAWTSTSPSSEWPLERSASATARRVARSGAARRGRGQHPVRFGSAARRSP